MPWAVLVQVHGTPLDSTQKLDPLDFVGGGGQFAGEPPRDVGGDALHVGHALEHPGPSYATELQRAGRPVEAPHAPAVAHPDVRLVRCPAGPTLGRVVTVPRRLAAHQLGKGAKYTRSRAPVNR